MPEPARQNAIVAIERLDELLKHIDLPLHDLIPSFFGNSTIVAATPEK